MILNGRIATLSRAATVLAALLALPLVTGCSVQASVDMAGTAPPGASDLWVTVDQVWLATAADTAPEATAGWQKYTLPTPVTVDLATLTAGTLAQVMSGQKIPPGTYTQLHLALEDPADPLSASAQALGLTDNAQMSLTDTNGNLVAVPLEFAVPRAGLTIPVNLTFSASLSADLNSASLSTNGTTTSPMTSTTTPTASTASTSASASTTALAVTIDAARDVVFYALGSTTAFILSPIMRTDDESASGAINGSVDVSALPTGHAPVYVSAETPDSTQTHHVVVQRSLVGADGSFTLYPLPVATQGSQTYDLVVSCAGAQTMIIRGVSVSAGSVTSPTTVQSTPITLTSAATAYADLSPAPVVPAGTRVDFYETIAAAGEIPYVIDATAVDPLTRRLPTDAFALATSTLAIGTYAGGGAITFASASPAEGNGGYLIGTEGLYRTDTLAAKPTLISGTAGAPSLVSAPSPALATGAVPGTVAVNVAVANTSLDSGFITVSAGGRIVETADISKLLQAGGGTATISGLPAGSTLAPTSGPSYQLAVRAWSSGNPAGTVTRVAAPASISLGDSTAVSTSIQVP